MSLPRYPKYKDSKVEWLGEVPAHWVCVRLATLFREVNEPGSDDMPVLSVSIHDGVSDRELDENEMERKVTRSDDRAKYKAVAPGDLTYNMMRAWQGGFGTVTVYGMVSPAYVVARPMWDFLTSHVEMLLRTPMAISEIKRYSRGITDFRLRLYWEDFKGLRIALPPLAEQLAIASFLGRETAKIDALIAEQEKLLVLLAEKREATILRAVTRGLAPDVLMKDSGIAWLGEVPAHWAVGALGYLCSIETGATPDRGDPSYWNGSIPWLKTGEINWAPISEAEEFITELGLANSAAKLAKPGTLLMAMYGQGVTRGRVALLDIEAAYNQACAAMSFGARILPNFARYFFMAAYGHLRDSGNETSQMNLSAGLIAKFKITIPPVDEQTGIISWLDSEVSKLDSLDAEAGQAIELLKERRSALIAAAVTGKIDVRDAVARELAA